MARIDVLAVDDEQPVLRAIRRVIGEDHTIETTADPIEALARLKSEPPRVLITDFSMPVMNGTELLREACKVAPDTIRILLTGQADRSDIIEAINIGKVFRYIAKPWQNAHLVNVVAEALVAHEGAIQGRSLRGQAEMIGELQRALLPQRPPAGADAACHATACEFATGDYLDTVALPNGKTAILLGDVCGHGLGAALFVFTARALLRSGLVDGLGLAELLDRTNRFLCRDMEDGRFLTLFVAVHDPHAQTLTYANAGHLPPFVITGERLVECEGTALPLGLFDETSYSQQHVIPIAHSDTLVAYTDGVVEARRADDELFGKERLIATLENGRADSPEALVDRIRADVHTFCGAAGLEDDLALLVYRPRRQQQLHRLTNKC